MSPPQSPPPSPTSPNSNPFKNPNLNSKTLTMVSSSKRSRLARSSSSGDISVLSDHIQDHRRPPPVVLIVPTTLPANIRQAVKYQPPMTRNISDKASVFSVSSSELESVDRKWNELVPYGGFLEKCFYCKKKLCRNKDIFMYSNLRAFCSVECREKKIEMDEDLQRLTDSPMVRPAKRR